MPIDQATLDTLKACCKDEAAFERARALFESHMAKCNKIGEVLQHTVETLQGEVRERVKLEAELREREAFYRAIFENTNLGITYVQDRHIVRANQAFSDMLGYTPDELSKLTIEDITHPDDYKAQLPLIEGLECGEISNYAITKRYRHKDGHIIWARLQVSRFQDAAGNILGIVAASDITDNIKNQEQLRQSEAQLAWLLNALPFAIAIYKNKIPVFANRAFYESRGLSNFDHWLEAKSQESFNDDYALIHPDDYKTFIANIDEYRAKVEKGEVLKVERRIRRYGQTEYLWYECSIFKGDYVDGQKVVVEVDVSIQERKQAELELLKVQNLLSETEKLAYIGSWEYDIKTGATLWTKEVYRIYERDFSLPPLRNEAYYAQIHPDDLDLMKSAHQQVLQGNPYNLTLRILTDTGKVKWVQTIGVPVYEHGRVTRIFGLIHDISEQKQLEAEKELLYQQLLHAQKMEAIGVLASGVAHEFNNILTGILGATMLLKKEVAGNPKGEKRIAQIETASQRAATIVKQMLGFARQGKMNVQSIDFQECIKNVLDMFLPTLDKQIRIVTDFQVDDATSCIQGDKGQIEQVILNLAVNARDAIMQKLANTTIRQGEISFTLTAEPLPKALASQSGATSEEPMLHLAISDNGAGIPKEIQDKIFEPFFTTKEVGKGTGLGLSMVYGIVKNHQGLISVESLVGEGTTFHLYFPLSEKQTVQIHSKETANAIGTIKGTILVVDDEPVIREYLSEILEENGYLVYTEKSGKSGFAFFEAHREKIDLVVTDRNMPELDGEHLLMQLKSIRPSLPVILITGNVENDITERLEQNGAHKVLRKPFDPEELLSAISQALRVS